MFMANNYTDTTDTDFTGVVEGVAYNIDTGKPLSAAGVRNALHTKENVANKQVSSTNDTADVLDTSSSDSYYPSSKLAGKNFAALRSGKQDKIAAGTANDILTKTTTIGTLGVLTKTMTLETNTTSASDEKIPTEKAVATALSDKASSSDLAAKQDKIAAGTANDILTKTITEGVLSTLTKTTSIRTGSTIDTAPDDTRIPTEKAVADAVQVVKTAVETVNTAISNLSFQAALPIGTILMYDGAAWQDNITLVGWYACTKANNNLSLTPNLEDKFIKGKGDKAATGDGQMTLTKTHLPKHEHSIEDKEHTHTVSDKAAGDGQADTHPDGDYFVYDASVVSKAWTSVPKINMSYTGITKTEESGEGEAFDVLPSYYSVIYIKKVN
ncbi:hypothetical protein NO1_0979 [Candidatus Termititenax aidoneus]|uniref:Phage tail fiber protein n=1 Tax=Termititenax aidoneus TaxID=2218524 RepID=A0A388TAH6_TERA1|nr:hypothetical protein NO1_0979 [Candidatus Termititenax aidoneus]